MRALLVMGLLWLGGVHAVPKQAAFYNELSFNENLPYGVGALSLQLGRGQKSILLPGHYLSFERSFAVSEANVRVAKRRDGSFKEVLLPKACHQFVRPGSALYVRGHIDAGQLHDVTCKVEPYAGASD